MSITFWIPEAPEHTVSEECVCVQLDGEPEEGCYFCDGTGVYTREESTAPSCNFSCANAHALLVLIGLDGPEDYCGEVPVEEAPVVIRRAIRAKNLRSERRWFDREPSQGVGRKGCRYYEGGNTDAATLRRLDAVLTVLKYAVDHGQRMIWN